MTEMEGFSIHYSADKAQNSVGWETNRQTYTTIEQKK